MTPSERCTRIRQLLPDRPCRPTEPPDPEKGESTSALGVSSQSIGALPVKCPQCPSELIRPTSSCERRGIELIRSFDSARGIRPRPTESNRPGWLAPGVRTGILPANREDRRPYRGFRAPPIHALRACSSPLPAHARGRQLGAPAVLRCQHTRIRQFAHL